jgi:phosphohistidine swiveling domain-containing protein
MNSAAMVRTSVEMHDEGILQREEAITRVNPAHLEQMLFPRLDPAHKAQPIATGLPASPGAASGQAVFDADRAEELGRKGVKVLLVREETKPEDIHGFFAAQAILTSRGGKTSHAAVVARGMGKPCVSGCEAIVIDSRERRAAVGGVVLREGDVVTIDGSTGNVYAGEIPTIEAEFFAENRGQFLHREIDFEDMPTGRIARPAFARLLGRCQGIARIAVSLPGAAGAFLSVPELRDLDLRQRNADQMLPFLANQLAPRDVFGKVGFHLAAYDLAETLMITIDFLSHGSLKVYGSVAAIFMLGCAHFDLALKILGIMSSLISRSSSEPSHSRIGRMS